MNREEWLKDFYEEQLWKEIEKLSNKYYKTPWSLKQQMLSVMSDSDIAIIIWDKRKEWGVLEYEKKSVLKWKRIHQKYFPSPFAGIKKLDSAAPWKIIY